MKTGVCFSIQTETSCNPIVQKTGLQNLRFRSEHKVQNIFRFNLYYFSNTITKEKKDTLLMIDTRGNKSRSKTNDYDDFDEVEEDPLEKAIQSK